MLREILGIEIVERLYVELLFRCNFRCSYCYHGERLDWGDSFTLEELSRLVSNFQSSYDLQAVTILGGEPFLYKELESAVRLIKAAGLGVAIITNGYKIQRRLGQIAPMVDELRVSLDGLEENHDALRKNGSFKAVLDTLLFAKSIGLATSVTITVTELSRGDVIPLSRLLGECGVGKIDAHCVRPVGGGVREVTSSSISHSNCQILEEEIVANKATLPVPVFFEDEDFHPACLSTKRRRVVEEGTLDRLNLQANGEAYLSCKYTGTGFNSFFYDKTSGLLHYLGSSGREVDLLGFRTKL